MSITQDITFVFSTFIETRAYARIAIMNNEAETLYKLIILYMLRNVRFPLNNSHITDFLISHNYTNFFKAQETLHSLVEDQLLDETIVRNATQYRLTDNGRYTIDSFRYMLPKAIQDDIESYLKAHQYDYQAEVGITSDYYKATSGDYVVHCQIQEDAQTVFELNLSVPDKAEAEQMSGRWRDASQDIYSDVMHRLLRGNGSKNDSAEKKPEES